MKRKTLIYGLVILAAVVAWAAFRPERLFVNAKVYESMPTANANNSSETVLASGKFHGVAHDSSGEASVYQLADGTRILRFTKFATSNGPDVHVYLVAANDATDSDTVKKAGFREIASLKGNIGDQNYELPADIDLAKYRAVTIWCQRFGVNFGTAPLSAQEASTGMTQVLASGTFHSVAHESAGTPPSCNSTAESASFASPTSRLPMALTFAFTWWRPPMRATATQSRRLGSWKSAH